MSDNGQQAGRMVDVLVVNDDPSLRSMLCEVLREEGFAVETAFDGEQALEALCRSPNPRVVLLDDLMPVVSGTALLQALDAEPELARRTACVFFTAAPEPLAGERIGRLQHLTVPVVPYPFTVAELLHVVEEALSTLRSS